MCIRDRIERDALLDAQNDQRRSLQSQLDRIIDAREDTLQQLDDVKNERETQSQRNCELSALLDAEKQLHQAAIKQHQGKNDDHRSMIMQLQETVTALSRDK